MLLQKFISASLRIATIVGVVGMLFSGCESNQDPVKPATNGTPTSPELSAPSNGSSIQGSSVVLRWNRSTDLDGDAVSYRLFLDTRTAETQIPLLDSLNTTYTAVNLTPNTIYHWKVAAKDSHGNSSESGIWSFTVKSAPPGAPSCLSPSNRLTNLSTIQTLRWSCSNPDNDLLFYYLYLDVNPQPARCVLTNSPNNYFQTARLDSARVYYWRVVAKNAHGDSTSSPVWQFSTATRAVSVDPGPTTRFPELDSDFLGSSISNGTLTLRYSGQPPLIERNDYIVGTRGQGYLCKAANVITSGHNLVVNTVDATLDDAFIRTHVDTSVVIRLPEQGFMGALPQQFDTITSFVQNGEVFTERLSCQRSGPFAHVRAADETYNIGWTFNNVTLQIQDGANRKVFEFGADEIKIGTTITLDIAWDIDEAGVHSIRMVKTEDKSLEVNNISIAGGFSINPSFRKSITILPEMVICPIPIGPILFLFGTKIDLGCEVFAALESPFTFDSRLTYTDHTQSGGEFDQNGWRLISSQAQSGEIEITGFETKSPLQFELDIPFVELNFNLKMFGIVGPEFFARCDLYTFEGGFPPLEAEIAQLLSYGGRIAFPDIPGVPEYELEVEAQRNSIAHISGPATPSQLSATNAGERRISLIWLDNSDNEDNYNVERMSDWDDWIEIGQAARNATSYFDNLPQVEDNYTYRVRAHNIFGYSAYSNEASIHSHAPGAPSDPQPANFAVNIPQDLELGWMGRGDPDGDFDHWTIGFGTDPTPIERQTNYNYPFNPGHLSAGTTYYWRVWHYDYAGHCTPGNVWSFRTTEEPPGQPPYAPSDPQPANNAMSIPQDLELGWMGRGDPDGDFDHWTIGFGTDPTPIERQASYDYPFNPGHLDAGTTYYWQVWHYDRTGHCTPGEVWRFTTAGQGDNRPPNQPYNPQPTDGATEVPVNVDLRWSVNDPDGDEVWCSIGWSTNENDIREIPANVDPPYTLRDLQTGTRYYWRIWVEDTHGARTMGPIWRFTTEDSPNGNIRRAHDGDENIPDYDAQNQRAGMAWLAITIDDAPNEARIAGIEFEWQVNHSWHGDLHIYIASEQNAYNLLERNPNNNNSGNVGGGQSNLYFAGEPVNQTFFLVAEDWASQDTGYLDYFRINIIYNNGRMMEWQVGKETTLDKGGERRHQPQPFLLRSDDAGDHLKINREHN